MVALGGRLLVYARRQAEADAAREGAMATGRGRRKQAGLAAPRRQRPDGRSSQGNMEAARICHLSARARMLAARAGQSRPVRRRVKKWERREAHQLMIERSS